MSDDYAAQMRQLDAESQAKIQQGLRFIERIFGGGTTGSGQTFMYQPGQTYYNVVGQQLTKNLADPVYLKFLYDKGYLTGQGQPVTTTNVGGNRMNNRTRVGPVPTTGGTPTTLDRWDEYMRNMAEGGNLYTGTQTHEGFNDAFYAAREQDFMNATQPQLAQQYRDMVRNVEASLARRGNLGGSAQSRFLNTNEANGPLGTLYSDYQRQQADLQNRAADYGAQVKRNVLDQRNTVTQQLLQSQNPTLAAQSAAAAASAARVPSPIPALGQAFGDWANIYFNQSLGRDIARNQSMQPQVRYGFAQTPVSSIS